MHGILAESLLSGVVVEGMKGKVDEVEKPALTCLGLILGVRPTRRVTSFGNYLRFIPKSTYFNDVGAL
jgi:hypothetical protein